MLSQAAMPLQARRRGGLVRRLCHTVCDAVGWSFGCLSMIVILAVLATIPLVQLLSLGYLLETSGRVARTGHLREGLIGVRIAGRVALALLGAAVGLVPLSVVSSLCASARLIAPGSRADRLWTAALVVITVLTVWHLVGAVWRGAKLRHFLWPRPLASARLVFRRGALSEARDQLWASFAALRLPYYFGLGLRGFVGGLVWLVPPITLIALGQRFAALGLLGAVWLGVVLLYLPLVQTEFAAENRFGAMIEVSRVRAVFCRAPWACWLAVLVTLGCALPLYLLKIEMIPREAAWLPSAVFVMFTLPARLLTGWLWGYARRRDRPRHAVFRYSARLAMLPVVAAYVVIVYFTQLVTWYGEWSLYEQHAFLVPAPFLRF